MSCGTSANAMSLVTQTSRPIRGKGADVMFGLSALSAGSRLQDLATTTSIKRCLPNLTMLPILPWQIQMLLQLCVFVIQQGGRWWIRKHCWIPHSFSFLPSCLKKAWIHKYPSRPAGVQFSGALGIQLNRFVRCLGNLYLWSRNAMIIIEMNGVLPQTSKATTSTLQ